MSNRVIPLWIKRALKNEDLIVYGGDKILDFVYIEDAIEGLIRVLDNIDNKEVINNVFNIASGSGVKLVDLAHKIIKLTNSKSKVIVKENRPGETTKFVADISKAQRILKYNPKFDIDKGLRATIQWYRKYYETCNKSIWQV